jgi:tetratricopeptide (TPR) repeat protein
MLAGVQAFIGATPEAALAQRLAHPPRRVSVYRWTVPPSLEDIVAKTLELAPADRFSSAGDLTQALTEVQLGLDSGTTPDRRIDQRKEVARNWHALLAAGVGIVAVAVVGGLGVQRWRAGFFSAAPDTTSLLYFPLERGGSADVPLTADDLLQEALARWRGIVLINRFQVAYALDRHGVVRSNAEAASIAQSLGAGRYIRGSIKPFGSDWRIYTALFDVRGSQPLYVATRSVPNDLRGAAAALSEVADSLLLRGARQERGADYERPLGTLSLPAAQAHLRALHALDEWDLAIADSFFQKAVEFDYSFARAQMWLAQVRAWRGLASATWSLPTERALAYPAYLSEQERILAEALRMLAIGRFEDACRLYDQLRRRNTRDFAAWFGLGQCRTMDRLVVSDSSSPSGWSFRSSYNQAMRAYGQAFELLPSVHRTYESDAFERLRVLLLVSRRVTAGFGAGPDSTMFYARPAWLAKGDSLALIPYPSQVVLSGHAEGIPPGFAKALQRQVEQFRRIAATWSAAFPLSAGAKQAVAISLELLGDPAAIDTLRLARTLALDSERKVRLAASEVLLRIKFGVPDDSALFAEGLVLADSLLELQSPNASQAAVLAPLAAIRGRCGLAEQLARRAGPPPGPLPVAPHLFIDAQALLARVALGCSPASSTPSISTLLEVIKREAYNAKYDARPWIEQVLLLRPTLLAANLDSAVVERLSQSSESKLLQAARAFTRHDTAGVRARLSELGAQWRVEMGAPTPDIVYPGARLWAAVGDTTMAVQWLERTLTGARTYDPETLSDQARAAAFVRAMLLRAKLANATRDTATARRWTSVVSLFWSTSDSELQMEVRRAFETAHRR